MNLLEKLIFSSKDLLRYYTAWGPEVKLLRMTLPEVLRHLGPGNPSQHHVSRSQPFLQASTNLVKLGHL